MATPTSAALVKHLNDAELTARNLTPEFRARVLKAARCQMPVKVCLRPAGGEAARSVFHLHNEHRASRDSDRDIDLSHNGTCRSEAGGWGDEGRMMVIRFATWSQKRPMFICNDTESVWILLRLVDLFDGATDAMGESGQAKTGASPILQVCSPAYRVPRGGLQMCCIVDARMRAQMQKLCSTDMFGWIVDEDGDLGCRAALCIADRWPGCVKLLQLLHMQSRFPEYSHVSDAPPCWPARPSFHRVEAPPATAAVYVGLKKLMIQALVPLVFLWDDMTTSAAAESWLEASVLHLQGPAKGMFVIFPCAQRFQSRRTPLVGDRHAASPAPSRRPSSYCRGPFVYFGLFLEARLLSSARSTSRLSALG
ncbi:hypothetical protein BDP55DRAFT_712594 [Colletotrichum godetiae]|uniref:Uncharacterized protein n=1 Tax=Colletotrichum godetiae TaxID=1209918 RepID=A0AAJ0AV86_9PEZI|nr:uncharacterized protein BDP55DRAFT_712594 [Colletotrichum godetiae]KAK1689480.1 hypothetical protein BDP55DRAFT_712594 [Colletotrichum godetiae]